MTINNIYLPLNRDLRYVKSRISSTDYILTQSGSIVPATAQSHPLRPVFHADKIDMTTDELTQLEDFYKTYHSQKFRFKDTEESQQIFQLTQIPDGLQTEFSASTHQHPHRLYFTDQAQIFVDDILQPSAIIDSDFNITFTTPPTTNSVITVTLDFDYAVLFDYGYGLQTQLDPKTKSHKVSFRLVV